MLVVVVLFFIYFKKNVAMLIYLQRMHQLPCDWLISFLC